MALKKLSKASQTGRFILKKLIPANYLNLTVDLTKKVDQGLGGRK